MPLLNSFWALFAVAILSIFSLLAHAAGDSPNQNIQGPEFSITNNSEPQTLTVDLFLAAAFRDKKSSYIDLSSGALTIQDTLIINPEKFAPSELPKLRTLMESGKWLAENGQHYDLTKATMFFRDGKGGLGDRLAFFASDEFSQIIRNPFGVNYPPSPYLEGMSPDQFIEVLIGNLGPEHYHIDGATGTVVVQSLSLPLHDLDEKFCLDVISIAVSGKIWVSASGAQYDFSKTAVAFPISEIGTPEQRQVHEERRRQVVDELYSLFKKATPTKRTQSAIIARMNSLSRDSLQNSLLKRFENSVFMEPIPVCDQFLLKQVTKDTK